MNLCGDFLSFFHFLLMMIFKSSQTDGKQLDSGALWRFPLIWFWIPVYLVHGTPLCVVSCMQPGPLQKMFDLREAPAIVVQSGEQCVVTWACVLNSF